MIKSIFTLFLAINFIFASAIDKKIEQNQKSLESSKKTKDSATVKIKEIADKIEVSNTNLSKLEEDIIKINEDIEQHQKLLESSQTKLNELQTKSSDLIKEKNSSEEEIINTIVEQFSTSLALQLASKESLQELIDNEMFNLLSTNAKQKVLKLNENYNRLTENTKANQQEINKLNSYIKDRLKTKENYKALQIKHTNSLATLEKEHKLYQAELKKVIEQQDSLNKILSDLKIVKQQELRKAQEQKVADNQQVQTTNVRNQKYAKDLDLDVKKIGSSTDGVQIVKYKGVKTIAPLKSFKIVKNFGTYYDPVYKIKLFNESVVLQSNERDSKVVAVLNGKVVYAKKNAGMLENVVIIQHEGGIHTVYSHLDDIAPTLVVGKWVQKGSVVGRVNQNLTFQVTKDSAHIDPKDLFNI
ncbi:peptidase M23 [Aliarcobacter trophiarum LMG 25534]|uniref:Peptidase M23 n=1 Tax=Aliarcobacter trophiarum LMG 25534 TaxID=1032241 RepID=A0AAD0QJR4_9BACT|nr:M23 family metallopeptidase [Aliarcobacter trophiarum]AXK49153.1 zinc metallopeptidase, M23 family [Aliarcobacter trophiarum LMG 25534]RXI26407.1 peptidase M23 [Aliarcobacter trophiarum]RXJ89852.1 peptidase M23 [Aliarcobacter trophiarum LMG 25534]